MTNPQVCRLGGYVLIICKIIMENMNIYTNHKGFLKLIKSPPKFSSHSFVPSWANYAIINKD